MWLRGKESAANAGDAALIPGSERSSEGGNGNPPHTVARIIPRTEEPAELQSMGLQKVRRDRSD